eukprot:6919158-Lingulodinium_polyedra.AAC.1
MEQASPGPLRASKGGIREGAKEEGRPGSLRPYVGFHDSRGRKGQGLEGQAHGALQAMVGRPLRSGGRRGIERK